MVNTQGRRFASEDGAYWEIAEAIEAQPDSRAFFVFDRRLFEDAKPHPRVLEALAAGAITVSWVPKVFDEQLQKGGVSREPDDRGTRGGRSVSTPPTLAMTVTRYTDLAASRR